MPKDWLVYWRKDQIEAAVSDQLLNEAASEQFSRVESGDVLWISGQAKSSRLVTVGPLHVFGVVNQKEAERRLQCKLRKAKYHALVEREHETAAREVSLDPVLTKLRFISQRRPNLDLNKPLGLQLQSIRQLTQSSAQVLRRLWDTALARAMTDFDNVQTKLARLSDLDENIRPRKIEGVN